MSQRQPPPAAAPPRLPPPHAGEGWGRGFSAGSLHLSPAGGVRIAEIDLSLPLSPTRKDAIVAAFLAHHVVVFPDQSLTREQQFLFAANFGAVEVHGAHRGETKRYGVAHVMSNLGADGKPAFRISRAANYHWHTDKPYNPAPPLMTMLYAVELPPAGGDTEFANMTLAYAALPEEIKHRIAGLRVAFRPAFDDSRPGADHPLVRTHPDTGAKSLYMGNHSTGMSVMPEAEGRYCSPSCSGTRRDRSSSTPTAGGSAIS